MKLNKKYFALVGSIVILAGMLFIPVASAHGTDTTEDPMGPSYDDGQTDATEYTQPYPDQTYRGGCHGGYAGGQYGSGYDTHQGSGWFGGHGMTPWFNW